MALSIESPLQGPTQGAPPKGEAPSSHTAARAAAICPAPPVGPVPRSGDDAIRSYIGCQPQRHVSDAGNSLDHARATGSRSNCQQPAWRGTEKAAPRQVDALGLILFSSPVAEFAVDGEALAVVEHFGCVFLDVGGDVEVAGDVTCRFV